MPSTMQGTAVNSTLHACPTHFGCSLKSLDAGSDAVHDHHRVVMIVTPRFQSLNGFPHILTFRSSGHLSMHIFRVSMMQERLSACMQRTHPAHTSACSATGDASKLTADTTSCLFHFSPCHVTDWVSLCFLNVALRGLRVFQGVNKHCHVAQALLSSPPATIPACSHRSLACALLSITVWSVTSQAALPRCRRTSWCQQSTLRTPCASPRKPRILAAANIGYPL